MDEPVSEFVPGPGAWGEVRDAAAAAAEWRESLA